MNRAAVALTIALLAMPRAALAEEAAWTVGVTPAQKTAAQKLLEAGNALFLARDYGAALEKYRAAVAQWNHPAIRFNMVRCLIQLERTIDAADELALALQYGAKPLEEAVYSEALSYQKLLANQIGELEVSCDQPGVVLTLDGQPLPACPTTEKRRVAPGPHQLVGTRDRYLTRTLSVVAVGGKLVKTSLHLEPLTSAARVVHRYPTWAPWAVVGSGLVVAGVGVLLDQKAATDFDNFDRNVSTQCGSTGCAPDHVAYAGLEAQRRSAERLDTIGVGVIVTGAAIAVTGGVMLYLNRGRTVYAPSSERLAPQVSVAVLPDGGAMATLRGGF